MDSALGFALGRGFASLTPAGVAIRCFSVLAHDRPLRRTVLLVAKVAPDLGAALALLGSVTLLYAWFATLVFPNTSKEGKAVFPTYAESLWQLLILATTSNYPDVQMRAYSRNRATFFFFGSFLVICLW